MMRHFFLLILILGLVTGCIKKEPEGRRELKGVWHIQNSGGNFSKYEWTFKQKGQTVEGRDTEGNVYIKGTLNGKHMMGQWEDTTSLTKGNIQIELISPFKMKGLISNGGGRSNATPFTGSRIVK